METIKKDSIIQLLKECVVNYNRETSFKAGDIVQWKSGLKNKKIPVYNQPCIVVEVLSDVLFDLEAPIASPYYNETLSIKLGMIAENEEFFTFYYDKSRFEVINEDV